MMVILGMSVVVLGAETIVFNGGLSRQNAGGTINLLSGYSPYLAGGMEVYDDLCLLLKFTFPGNYASSVSPVMVDINGVDDTLDFDEFTMYDLMLMGHYTLTLSETSKINPKIFGGLGLHWLNNSRQIAGESDVKFSGIGPEFGLGGIYKASNNLQFDFTLSIKFPYYNVYKKQYANSVAIGNDEQVLCFNVSLFYLFKLGSDVNEFEW